MGGRTAAGGRSAGSSGPGGAAPHPGKCLRRGSPAPGPAPAAAGPSPALPLAPSRCCKKFRVCFFLNPLFFFFFLLLLPAFANKDPSSPSPTSRPSHTPHPLPFLFPYITGPRGAENRKGLSFTSHIPRTIRAPPGAAGGPGGRSAPARRPAPVGCARSQSRPGGGRGGRRAPLRAAPPSTPWRHGCPRSPVGLLPTFVPLWDAGAVPTRLPEAAAERPVGSGPRVPRCGARPAVPACAQAEPPRTLRGAGQAPRTLWLGCAARRGGRWGSAGRGRAGPAAGVAPHSPGVGVCAWSRTLRAAGPWGHRALTLSHVLHQTFTPGCYLQRRSLLQTNFAILK